MSDQRAMTFSERASPTNVTLPDENLCHYITDDQLRRLGEMRKDMVMEICLASGGVFFGSLIPALNGFARFGAATDPATWTDLLSMLLCAAALVAMLITGYQWRVRQKGHVDLVEEIRNRPKVSVRLVHDHAA